MSATASRIGRLAAVLFTSGVLAFTGATVASAGDGDNGHDRGSYSNYDRDRDHKDRDHDNGHDRGSYSNYDRDRDHKDRDHDNGRDHYDNGRDHD
ncbi:hypothetical protein ABZ078_22355 [Streptomyces sp. NPDC006385]|uniref:hypothetical protein n=1 Tax=Streptomyces sp. NPDC006385 TaxID=3156761 RepID=UPI00339E834E